MKTFRKLLLILAGTSSQAFARTANQVYVMPSSGNVPVWSQVNLSSASAVTGLLGVTYGGSANISVGALLFGNGTASAASVLPIGSTGNVLTIAGGVPTWALPSPSNVVNALINSNFDYWQRTNSLSGTGYAADRWKMGGSGSQSTNLVAFSPGQTQVPNNPTYYLETTPTGGSPLTSSMGQGIEQVTNFSGQSVTVSFWARGSHLVSNEVFIDVYQNFGSGGSSQVDVGVQTIPVTTSWAQYTATFSVPSISGKTVGSGNNLLLQFSEVLNNGGLGGFVDYAQIMLAPGTNVSAWEYASGGTVLQGSELALAQRFYELSTNLIFYGIGSDTIQNNQIVGPYTHFTVSKRSTPTVVAFSENGTPNTISVNRVGSSFAVDYPFNSINGFTLRNVSGSAQAITNTTSYTWTADADF